jgi:hypothetical protein
VVPIEVGFLCVGWMRQLSDKGQARGTCEQGSEPSASIKGGAFRVKLSHS